jgi:hypothetical protein
MNFGEDGTPQPYLFVHWSHVRAALKQANDGGVVATL